MDADRAEDAFACAKAAAAGDEGALIHEALPVLAMAALREGDAQAAVAWTVRALRNRDDDERVWLLHAVALLEARETAHAQAALERLLQLSPEHIEARMMLAWMHARQGRWDDAEDLAQQLLVDDPVSPDAHALMAVVLNTRGAREAAEQALQRASRLDADNASVVCARALLNGGTHELLEAAVGRVRATWAGSLR
jgi:Flp pilus assembly protein TadD